MTERTALTVFLCSCVLILTVEHNHAETHNSQKQAHTAIQHSLSSVSNPETDGSKNIETELALLLDRVKIKRVNKGVCIFVIKRDRDGSKNGYNTV